MKLATSRNNGVALRRSSWESLACVFMDWAGEVTSGKGSSGEDSSRWTAGELVVPLRTDCASIAHSLCNEDGSKKSRF